MSMDTKFIVCRVPFLIDVVVGNSVVVLPDEVVELMVPLHLRSPEIQVAQDSSKTGQFS